VYHWLPPAPGISFGFLPLAKYQEPRAGFWLARVDRPSAAGFALPFVFSQLPMAKSQKPGFSG
jgi:hypothetical protein